MACAIPDFITPDNDQEYEPEEYYYIHAISDHAVRYIEDHAREHDEKPFFMYVAYTSAHWPKGIKARNELRSEPGHLIDLMPTCVELAGAEYPKHYQEREILPMEGRSLVTGFDADREEERVLLFEHYGKAAIRRGSWKLVRPGDKNPWEFYAIDADRSEMHDT